MEQTLTLRRPDDWHLHVRDGASLKAVVPFSARQMGRAVIMPNLKPPITDLMQLAQYRQRIIDSIPADSLFEPLMTLYLTDRTTAAHIEAAKQANVIAYKLYPAGATTNSDNGVTDIFRLMPTLEAMAECQMPLLVHGEVTDENIDIFDREAVFIERILKPLTEKLPTLKIVMEHITTQEAARWIESAEDRIGATLTPQHLLMNRNHLLVGGVRAHHYCLPILKRESHRQALLQAISGKAAHRFFLGTDSAPHAQSKKECACGCAGVFSAHGAIEFYAEAFESINALHLLEAFASKNGARFYGLPENTDTITLIKKPQTVPTSFNFGDEKLIPLRAGETIAWSLQ